MRNHRIFTTLLIVACVLFFPRIIHGARRIWARNRTRPPLSWWCALPYGCGWGILMTGVAFAGRWENPPWWWSEIAVFLVFVWGFLALFHGFNAFMNWLERRKDVSFED